jgi:hypothetical protein
MASIVHSIKFFRLCPRVFFKDSSLIIFFVSCCVLWLVDPSLFISVLRQHCVLIISILQSTSASFLLVADYSSSKLFSFLTKTSHLCIVHLQSLKEGLEDVPMFAHTATNYLDISSNLDYHQGAWNLIVTVRDSKKHLSYYVVSFFTTTNSVHQRKLYERAYWPTQSILPRIVSMALASLMV